MIESETNCSLVKEGNDQTQQDQEGTCRTGNSGNFKSSIYRDSIPFFPISGLLVLCS
jgi:hypothetical protein